MRALLPTLLLPRRLFPTLPLSMLLLAGCASTTDITTHTVTDTPPPTATSILLAARSPEIDFRESWELTCRPIFADTGLSVHLAHQEVPFWQRDGQPALSHWTDAHRVDRILLVDLTRLLIPAPHLPDQRELNPLGQDTEVTPTWRVGLDGERIPRAPLEDTEARYPAYLMAGDGASLWYGEARTHEANDPAAIAHSQCRALRDALHDGGLLP